MPIYFAMKGTNSLRKIYSLATLSWQGIGWSTMTSKDFEVVKQSQIKQYILKNIVLKHSQVVIIFHTFAQEAAKE